MTARGTVTVAIIVVLLAVAGWLLRTRAHDLHREGDALRGTTGLIEVELEHRQPAAEPEAFSSASYQALLDSLPAKPYIWQILSSLSSLETETSASVVAFDAGPPVAAAFGPAFSTAPTHEIHLSIAVAGGETEVRRFIDELRELDRLIVIHGVEFAWRAYPEDAGADDGAARRLEAHLGARAFLWSPAFVAGGYDAVASVSPEPMPPESIPASGG